MPLHGRLCKGQEISGAGAGPCSDRSGFLFFWYRNAGKAGTARRAPAHIRRWCLMNTIFSLGMRFLPVTSRGFALSAPISPIFKNPGIGSGSSSWVKCSPASRSRNAVSPSIACRSGGTATRLFPLQYRQWECCSPVHEYLPLRGGILLAPRKGLANERPATLRFYPETLQRFLCRSPAGLRK